MGGIILALIFYPKVIYYQFKTKGGMFGTNASQEWWLLVHSQIWSDVSSGYHWKLFLLGAVHTCLFGFRYTKILCVLSLVFCIVRSFKRG